MRFVRFAAVAVGLLVTGLASPGHGTQSKGEIVANRPPPWEGAGSMELTWAAGRRSWNDSELFFTLHAETDRLLAATRAAVYRKVDAGYLELLAIQSEGMFDEPQAVWLDVPGSRRRTQLLRLTEVQYGTGHVVTEHLYEVLPDMTLRAVDFEPAPAAFRSHLGEGEGVWKGEVNQLGEDGMTFEFSVWREGDANCCPTGGEVTGRYRIRDVGGEGGHLEIRAREFRRSPVPGEGSDGS